MFQNPPWGDEVITATANPSWAHVTFSPKRFPSMPLSSLNSSETLLRLIQGTTLWWRYCDEFQLPWGTWQVKSLTQGGLAPEPPPYPPASNCLPLVVNPLWGASGISTRNPGRSSLRPCLLVLWSCLYLYNCFFLFLFAGSHVVHWVLSPWYILQLSNQQKLTPAFECQFQSTVRKTSASLRSQRSLAPRDKQLWLWEKAVSHIINMAVRVHEGCFQRNVWVGRKPKMPLILDWSTCSLHILCIHKSVWTQVARIFVDRHTLSTHSSRTKFLCIFLRPNKHRICIDLRQKSVFVFYGCHNKVLQTGRLRTTEDHALSSAGQRSESGCGQSWLLLEALGDIPASLLAPGSCWHFLALLGLLKHRSNLCLCLHIPFSLCFSSSPSYTFCWI